jgi:hypothetical protein
VEPSAPSPVRGRRGGLAFLAYLAVAFLVLGLPVVSHPESRVAGGLFTDPQIFIWSLAWWPHAILHGENPFVSHAIWAPGGFDLAWATSIPGLAIVLAPVTLLFGATLAYNVAVVLMPALAAWTAFLLCRRLTRGAFWPSLAGGYLFGFSSYVMSAALTHVHTEAVFLLPVAALLVLRFLDGDLSGPGLGWRMGALLAAQMLISTEILFTLTLALVVGLLLGALIVPASRGRLGRIVAPLAGAYALAALVTAPFLYYVVSAAGERPPSGSFRFNTDIANLVVPTMATVGGWWTRHFTDGFPGNDAERGAYLGVPLLAVIAFFAWSRRRSAGAWFLVVAFGVAVFLSLGVYLTVDGHQSVRLVWSWLYTRPLFENTMPVRLMAYASLAAAVMAALWASSRFGPAWLRGGLTALAVLTLVPNVSWNAWSRSPQVPHLFTTSLYRKCLGRGETVLLLPFGTDGDAEIWQVRSGFWFEDAGGYVSPYPPASYTQTLGVQQIATEKIPPDVGANQVLQLVRLEHVTSIVVDAAEYGLWAPVLRSFGRPQEAGGAFIYRLRGAPPLRAACSAAS